MKSGFRPCDVVTTPREWHDKLAPIDLSAVGPQQHRQQWLEWKTIPHFSEYPALRRQALPGGCSKSDLIWVSILIISVYFFLDVRHSV